MVPRDDMLRYIAYALEFVAPGWPPAVRVKLREISAHPQQQKRIKALSECRARAEGARSGIHRSKKASMTSWSNLRGWRNAKKGCVSLDEMKEIADMVKFSSRFPSFEQFLEALGTNNLVLESGPTLFRMGNSTL
jgi:hypothetical protein